MKEKRRRRKNPKMNQETTKYDKILQELKSDYSALLDKYLPKLHQACHEDISLKVLSHMEIVKKIRQDCINICSEASERITLAGEGEEDVIKEILEYNYDMADIKYMKEVEKVNLFLLLQELNKNFVKRTDPEWFVFGIHDRLLNGKADLGQIGSKRTQFCKCCGKEVYLSYEPAG
jgi:hypothetical protein